MKHLKTIAVLAALGAVIPMQVKADGNAKDDKTDLSTQCQTKAFSAHPASLPNSPAVANLRHSYYALCMDRQGTMNTELGGGD